jgi:hypothetical protein
MTKFLSRDSLKKFWTQTSLRPGYLTPGPEKSSSNAFIVSGLLTKTSKKNKASIERRYFLINNEFIYIKSSGCHYSAKLDYPRQRLDFTATKGNYSFTISKGTDQKTFRCADKTELEKWIKALRKFLILQNFDAAYKIIKKIGLGGSSEVFEAEHKVTKQKYAVKVIEKNAFTSARLIDVILIKLILT